jgi:hypothetical protein
MSYRTPQVDLNKIVYRSNRFVVIEIADGAAFDGWTRQECDFVCYDKLKTCVISRITRLADGKLECHGMGLYSTPKVFASIQDAMAWIPEESRLCEQAFLGR